MRAQSVGHYSVPGCPGDTHNGFPRASKIRHKLSSCLIIVLLHYNPADCRNTTQPWQYFRTPYAFHNALWSDVVENRRVSQTTSYYFYDLFSRIFRFFFFSRFYRLPTRLRLNLIAHDIWPVCVIDAPVESQTVQPYTPVRRIELFFPLFHNDTAHFVDSPWESFIPLDSHQ